MNFKPLFFLFMAGALAFAAGCRQPVEPFNQASLPGETVYFVPNNKKMIALTFDDGPNGAATEQILNVLHERKTPATFFVIGANAERFPKIMKRMVAEGHLVGNHTCRHPRFDQITTVEMEKDIADGSRAIETAAGLRPLWFRPPFGINGVGLEMVGRQQGLVIAGWSLDANDWNPHPVDELVDTIVSRATPGDIILLHDGWETRPDADRHLTVAAVPLIVDKLKATGFVFVTLPELLRNAGAPLAVFENGIRLLGMQIPEKPVFPGGWFGARYFWDVPENFTGNRPSAFVHFMKEGSKYFFQDDHSVPPRGDMRDRVFHSVVHVPKNAPAGKYKMEFGLFPLAKPEAKDRLKVRSDFPQARRAVYLPVKLEVAPEQAERPQGKNAR